MGCTQSQQQQTEGHANPMLKGSMRPEPYVCNSNSSHLSFSTNVASPKSLTALKGSRKKAKGVHPLHVVEIALRTQSALKMPLMLRNDLVKEVQKLAGCLGLTMAEFEIAAREDYNSLSPPTRSIDLMSFLIQQHYSIVLGKVTPPSLRTSLFGHNDSPTTVTANGGEYVEGTCAAEHFIIGGGGNVITGGTGSDVFMFLSRSDDDRSCPHILTDFDPSEDKIDLRALNISGFSELELRPQSHHHCCISGVGLDIILIGVHPTQLQESHFLFKANDFNQKVVMVYSSVSNEPNKADGGESEQPTTYVIQGKSPRVNSTVNADMFVFIPMEEISNAVIENFQVGVAESTADFNGDKIDLRGYNVVCLEDLQVTKQGNDVLISFAKLRITLVGIKVEHIHESHFVFGNKKDQTSQIAADSASPRADTAKTNTLLPAVVKSIILWSLIHSNGGDCGSVCESPSLKSIDMFSDLISLPTKDIRSSKGLSPRASPTLEESCFSWGLSPRVLPQSVSVSSTCSTHTGGVLSTDWLIRLQYDITARRSLRQIDRIIEGALGLIFTVFYNKVAVPISERILFHVKPRPVPQMELRNGYLLPPKQSKYGKYTVVLDLDETLVYSRHMYRCNQLCIRHGVHDLMTLLKQYHCEVIMWSAADAETVNVVWSAVDPTGITAFVLPREVWQRDVNEQRKDLKRLNRDLCGTILIDNTPLAVDGQVSNSILVRDFLGGECASDKKDELYSLIEILKSLFESGQDVPTFIKNSQELCELSTVIRKSEMKFNLIHRLPVASDAVN